jgi:AcrR family transcriptional regulator
VTPAERALRQRERLLAAIALALETTESPSVSEIVTRAGTSRNTFYAHFRDLAHARDTLVAQVVDALHGAVEAHFEQARTPLEAIRGLADAWIAALEPEIELSRAAFRVAAFERRGGLSRVASALRQHLRRATAEARRHGALSTPADELRSLAMASAMEALLGWYLDHPASPADARDLCADLLVRAFR